MHVLFEIFLYEFLLDLQRLTVFFRNRWDIGDTKIAGPLEIIHNRVILESVAHSPEGKHKRQPGQDPPALGEIEHLKGLRTQPHHRFLVFDVRLFVDFHELQRVVANEQGRVALRQHICDVRLGRP